MLDLHQTDPIDEKATTYTQIRHGKNLASLIERAATALGVQKSVFLRTAIAKEANRVIQDNSHHVLTEADALQFSKALDTPPTSHAKKAAASYKRRIKHAD